MPRPHVFLLAAALLAPVAAQAQSDPNAGGEAICTDRPTKSSNACAVEAGRFQLESDLFNGSFQRQGGVTTDIYLVTNPTLKYGLGANLDIEATLAPYEVMRTHDKFGASATLGGIGDLYLRLKYDILGQAGRAQAGVIASLKVPTARHGIGDGDVEGGLIVPLAYKLTDTLTVGLSPELDILADQAGAGRHAYTQQTVSLGYALPHDVTVYGELAGDWDFDPAGTTRQYSADVAVSWLVTKRFQLDGGLNFGLNAATPGVQAYVGVSQKF